VGKTKENYLLLPLNQHFGYSHYCKFKWVNPASLCYLQSSVLVMITQFTTDWCVLITALSLEPMSRTIVCNQKSR